MRTRNVLVFPAGTEIGLEIHGALRHCKEVPLFGAGAPVSSHAPFAFESFHHLSSIREANWLEELCALCRRLSIEYIFPAHDDIVIALARHCERIPVVVLTASLETCLTGRLKRQTCLELGSVLRVPRLIAAPTPSRLLALHRLRVCANCSRSSKSWNSKRWSAGPFSDADPIRPGGAQHPVMLPRAR